MTDLFLEQYPDEFLLKGFAVMLAAHWHTFIVLTKRAERKLEFFRKYRPEDCYTRSSQFTEWKQIDHIIEEFDGPLHADFLPRRSLCISNARCRCEGFPQSLPIGLSRRRTHFPTELPLLGPIDLHRIVVGRKYVGPGQSVTTQTLDVLRIAWQCSYCRELFSGALKTTCPSCRAENSWTGSHEFNPKSGQVGPGLNWVVPGFESGPNARPGHPDWLRSLRDQCESAGVPFFFKQWGEFAPFSGVSTKGDLMVGRSGATLKFPFNGNDVHEEMIRMCRVGKKAAGRLLDGKEHSEYPKTAEVAQ